MSRAWKPGDVLGNNTDGRWFVIKGGEIIDDLGHRYFASALHAPRPLAVIDTEFPATAVKHLRIAAEVHPELTTLGWLADQIEEQTKPAKVPEPGRFGVVIAGDGREWMRYTTSELHGRDWVRANARGDTAYARWDELDVVRVLSEGVVTS